MKRRLDQLPVELIELMLRQLDDDNDTLVQVRLVSRHLKQIASPLIRNELRVASDLEVNSSRSNSKEIEGKKKVVRGGLGELLSMDIGVYVLSTVSVLICDVHRVGLIRELLEYFVNNRESTRLRRVELNNVLMSVEHLKLVHWAMDNFLKLHLSISLEQYDATNVQLILKGGLEGLNLYGKNSSTLAQMKDKIVVQNPNLKYLSIGGSQVESISTQIISEFIRKLDGNILKSLNLKMYYMTDMQNFNWIPEGVRILKLYTIHEDFDQSEMIQLKQLECNVNSILVEKVSFPNLTSIKFNDVEFDRPRSVDLTRLFTNSPKLESFSSCYDKEQDLLNMFNQIPIDNCKIKHVELALWPDHCLGVWPTLISNFKNLQTLSIKPSQFSHCFYVLSDLIGLICRLLTSVPSVRLYFQIGGHNNNLGDQKCDDELLQIMPEDKEGWRLVDSIEFRKRFFS